MSEYRVPKRRLPVQVTLAGGAQLHVQLFLAPFASNHLGPERVEDLLNGPHDFIPAQEVGSGAMTLLNRSALVVARVTHEGVDDPPPDELECVEHEVQVHLLDPSLGESGLLHGRLRYARPEANGRVSDFLNEPSPFLELLSAEGSAFVSKRHVARIDVGSR